MHASWGKLGSDDGACDQAKREVKAFHLCYINTWYFTEYCGLSTDLFSEHLQNINFGMLNA